MGLVWRRQAMPPHPARTQLQATRHASAHELPLKCRGGEERVQGKTRSARIGLHSGQGTRGKGYAGCQRFARQADRRKT
jgi:hypothetical protein